MLLLSYLRLFLTRRWFLSSLVILLVAGIYWYQPLEPLAAKKELRYGVVAVVLFLMALPLSPAAIWRTVRQPWAPVLAILINIVLTPLVAWVVARWAPGLSVNMGYGLLVAAATPCTLASAAVWTRRAGGNDAVAILVTIVTNFFCFLVTPFWLVTIIGHMPTLSMSEMVRQLGLLVVLPMAVAQLLRLHPSIAEFATRRRIQLGVLAQCGILWMIFIGSIQTGERLSGTSEAAPLLGELLWMISMVLGLHIFMLALGVALARLTGVVREDQIAIAFAGSQKTLMVGLQVAMELQVTILPMVTWHVGQLFIDTMIADRFAAETREEEKDEERGG